MCSHPPWCVALLQWQAMYGTDLFNFTGSNATTQKLILGGELCAWGDAAQGESGRKYLERCGMPTMSAPSDLAVDSRLGRYNPDAISVHASRR